MMSLVTYLKLVQRGVHCRRVTGRRPPCGNVYPERTTPADRRGDNQ